MELDYIRYFSGEEPSERMVLPLRETGVLGRRDGRWILVAWHESGRHPDTGLGSRLAISTLVDDRRDGPEASNGINVGGEWDITEVEDKKNYRATLDAQGNGPYTWQGGQIVTTQVHDRRWRGTWTQPGSDREGGFEVVLSEDEREAKGIWWYHAGRDEGQYPAPPAWRNVCLETSAAGVSLMRTTTFAPGSAVRLPPLNHEEGRCQRSVSGLHWGSES
jgi:hypothetical protein